MQPRTVFQPDRLTELSRSIKANGIIQPLIVQRSNGRFQLVAGERRWRAARMAGLDEVPVVIQEFASDKILEVALIENIQREDLNPVEVAQALDRLAKEYGLSHEEIGARTGKDRSTVSNLLRLLRLPREVQLLVAEQRLAMGHARAILGLPNDEMMVEVGEKVSAQGMSVRQTERLVNQITRPRDPQSEVSPSSAPDPNVNAAVRELESALGTRVRIIGADRGRIEIDFFTADDLDRIYNLIVGEDKAK